MRHDCVPVSISRERLQKEESFNVIIVIKDSNYNVPVH